MKQNKILSIFVAIVLFAGLSIFIADTPYRNSRKLQSAIKENDVEKVQKLLDDGVDPNVTDIPISKLWRLFETHADTPLAIACEYGNYDIVKLLIDYGATTKVEQYTGYSPLYRTLFRYENDDLKIVTLLLENGGVIESDSKEESVLFKAVSMFPRTYTYDENSNIVWSDYDEQAAKDITDIVKLMIEDETANYNYAGENLLMVAIKRKNIPLVQYLLTFECDLDFVNPYNGKTAYDYAIETGNQEIIDLLS